MLYDELKSFFDNWMKNNPEKTTLHMGCGIIRDIHFTVRAHINVIDSTPVRLRKKSKPCGASKNNLQKIHDAIIAEKFDISGFSYGYFSNFKNSSIFVF